MGVTSGATKSVEVLMDALSVLHGRQKSIAGLMEISNQVMKVDTDGIPMLMQAVGFLREALTLDSLTDKDAQIIRAKQTMVNILDLRSRDMSLSKLQRSLVEEDRKLETAIEEIKVLIKAASNTRKSAEHDDQVRMSITDEFMDPVGPIRAAIESRSTSGGWRQRLPVWLGGRRG